MDITTWKLAIQITRRTTESVGAIPGKVAASLSVTNQPAGVHLIQAWEGVNCMEAAHLLVRITRIGEVAGTLTNIVAG